MRPKPGLWTANRNQVADRWKWFYDGLYCVIPLVVAPAGAGSAHPLQTFGSPIAPPYVEADDITGTETSVVTTPWGPGLKIESGADNGDGITLPGGEGGVAIDGTLPYTAALLFSWDGTTGDERALISHERTGVSNGFRLRLSNASPANLETSNESIFTSAVTADDWYLTAARPHADYSQAHDIDVTLFDLTNGGVQTNQMTSGDSNQYGNATSEMVFGSHNFNDPGVGVTIAAVYVWARRVGDGELRMLAADPFGWMYRATPKGQPAADPSRFVNYMLASQMTAGTPNPDLLLSDRKV